MRRGPLCADTLSVKDLFNSSQEAQTKKKVGGCFLGRISVVRVKDGGRLSNSSDLFTEF